MAELATDLQAAGHRVSVVTTKPHYNRDPVAEASQPLAPMWGGLLYRSTFNGIPVLHTRIGQKRGGIAGRLFGWMQFHVLASVAALFLVERPDVVLVPSPLLTLGALGWAIARLRRGALLYNVQELYPDFAVKLGQLRNPLLIRMLLWLERFVYQRASAVAVIGEGMRQAIIAKGVPAEQVHLIPNFVDTGVLCPGARDNAFRRELGVGAAFVVTYAGNLGMAQGLDVLLEAAALLRDRKDIVFVLVGDGVLRDQLAGMIRDRTLDNARLVPHQPYARVPEIYAASDLCVVSMVGAIAAEAVPSKVLRIMACGRPVLAMTDASSDLARDVTSSGAGIVVPPASAAAVAQAVVEWADDPARCSGAGGAGRAWVTRRYSRPVVTALYSTLIDRLAVRTPRADAIRDVRGC